MEKETINELYYIKLYNIYGNLASVNIFTSMTEAERFCDDWFANSEDIQKITKHELLSSSKKKHYELFTIKL